jgi:hypothetical protein
VIGNQERKLAKRNKYVYITVNLQKHQDGQKASIFSVELGVNSSM